MRNFGAGTFKAGNFKPATFREGGGGLTHGHSIGAGDRRRRIRKIIQLLMVEEQERTQALSILQQQQKQQAFELKKKIDQQNVMAFHKRMSEIAIYGFLVSEL